MFQSFQPVIELSNVSKNFGPNRVLSKVSFDLLPGEIHALVGENGAGKSTTLGLLYGLLQADAGEVRMEGQALTIQSTAHAQDLGIGCVFQELSLAGELSVAENIYAGRTPSRYGFIDWPRLKKQAEELLSEFDVIIDVLQPVDKLPISTRQVVEIAKALSLNSKVLLLDEPTSALAPDEVKSLFAVLRKLVEKGIGIIYVSHRISEIFEISDRITVLRDGRKISTLPVNGTNHTQVVSDMIGRSVSERTDHISTSSGEVVLSVDDLTLEGEFKNVSFSLHAGEIVGLAGLMGSQRGQIAKALAGIITGCSGQVIVRGKLVHFHSLIDAMKVGIGYVPQERKTDGLFLDLSVRSNLVAASLEKHTRFGFILPTSAYHTAEKAIRAFSVKTSSPDAPIRSLSGGNQQKIMLAKWLETQPDILIIDEPTKGVDVGAKFQIHEELRKCVSEGMAILVVSSDFPELLALSDRIIVVHEGQVVGETNAEDATENSILNLAMGVTTIQAQSTQANQSKVS